MSVLTINENLKYSGDKLTEADIPLIQKIEIVDFIAEDMKSKGLSKASFRMILEEEFGIGYQHMVVNFLHGIPIILTQ